MWIEALVGALFFWYMVAPGDETGLPYPTTENEIRIEIGACEEFLEKTDYEFALLEARYEISKNNSAFSKDTLKVGGEYRYRKGYRASIRYRIKNLKKLLRKYEAINSQFNRNNDTPDSVRGAQEEPQNSMAVDDGTVGDSNPA